MGLFSFFQKKPVNTANLAKERLKIIVEHSRSDAKRPDFLNKMRLEILEVVRKYVDIDIDDINTNIASNGDAEILELNIILPDKIDKTVAASQASHSNDLTNDEITKNTANNRQSETTTTPSNNDKSRQRYGRNSRQHKN